MTMTKPVTVKTLLSIIPAEVLTDKADAEIKGCYIADLLSDVLARAEPGVLWVTIQTHRNVVSVAAMKDVPVVLITCGRRPDPQIIMEAQEEGIVLLATPLSTYEAAGKLWEAGLR